jgi:ATP synthase assembly factor FMC1, mitochondrial
MYTTLLERYNPGMGADEGEGERVRLTARRVGMEMPREWYEKKKEGDGR